MNGSHFFKIFNFIKKELGNDTDETNIETNLATVINILAKEDWDLDSGNWNYQLQPFEIERKIEFNNLIGAKSVVEDYVAHSNRVDKIYTEFNKQGVNKSISVLISIRKVYLEKKVTFNNDDLFFKVIEQVAQKIQQSSNYIPIPYDELELCINILVVDAFIRCKIFENPEGYIYVTP
jgi:hypothetical protein